MCATSPGDKRGRPGLQARRGLGTQSERPLCSPRADARAGGGEGGREGPPASAARGGARPALRRPRPAAARRRRRPGAGPPLPRPFPRLRPRRPPARARAHTRIREPGQHANEVPRGGEGGCPPGVPRGGVGGEGGGGGRGWSRVRAPARARAPTPPRHLFPACTRARAPADPAPRRALRARARVRVCAQTPLLAAPGRQCPRAAYWPPHPEGPPRLRAGPLGADRQTCVPPPLPRTVGGRGSRGGGIPLSLPRYVPEIQLLCPGYRMVQEPRDPGKKLLPAWTSCGVPIRRGCKAWGCSAGLV